jgi:hypothetical protein
VEAFPNAFLGVLMPEEELALAPKSKRGRRFDWLYEQVVTTGSGCPLGHCGIRGRKRVLRLLQTGWR